MKFVEWAKEHKAAALGIVAALIGLLYLLRTAGGSSSGSTQYVQTGPSDAVQAASIQAGAAASVAQAQSIQQAQQLQAQYNLGVLGIQQKTAEDNLASTVAIHMSDAETQQALAGFNTQADIAKFGAQSQVDLADISAKSTAYVTDSNNKVLTTQLLSQADQFKAQLSTEAAVRANDNTTSLGLAKVGSDTQLGLSADNAGVAKYTAGTALAAILGQYDSINKADANKTALANTALQNQATDAAAKNAIDAAKVAATLDYSKQANSNATVLQQQAIQAYNDLTYAQIVGNHESTDYALSIQQQKNAQNAVIAQGQIGVQNNAIDSSFWSSIAKTGASVVGSLFAGF
jgi:hypothetical protein